MNGRLKMGGEYRGKGGGYYCGRGCVVGEGGKEMRCVCMRVGVWRDQIAKRKKIIKA